VNDFHNWGSWSPYEKIDPTMTRRLSGSPSGKGAVYEWEGKGKAGAGRMEIIEAGPPARLAIKLDFIKPFEGHNVAEFTFAPRARETIPAATVSGSQGSTTEIVATELRLTEVTWAMSGPSPLMARVIGLFVDLDRMIGKDFETGLANLKSLTER
jgi:hypothetical protein